MWVAPENTATNPKPAKSAIGIGIIRDKVLPKVAPTKNIGVTSPPLKPAPKVNPVNNILSKKTYHGLAFEKESTIIGTPNPENSVNPKPAMAMAKMIPPIKGLNGGNFIFLKKKNSKNEHFWKKAKQLIQIIFQ